MMISVHGWRRPSKLCTSCSERSHQMETSFPPWSSDELTRLWNLYHNNMAACQSISRVVRNSNWLASPASYLGVPPTSSSPPTSCSRAWLTTWRAWSSNWPRSCLRTSRLRRLRQEKTMATPFSKRATTV